MLGLGTMAAQSHFDQGKLLSGAGKHAEAAAAFARAAALAPDFAEAHNHLGLAFRDQGRLTDAVESYRRALAIRADYIEVHNNLGAALQLQGKLDDALASYRRAVDLAPDFGQPYLNLGRLLEALGDKSGAAQAYRRALARGIEPATFRHLVNAAEGVTTTRAPMEYTRAVFDHFADHFDQRLVNELSYRIPEVIGECVTRHCNKGDLRVLDLGCGTGLCGLYLKDRCALLAGVDVSPAMLRKAHTRGIYHQLIEQDVADYLRSAPAAAFDAVIAADVLVYIGELTEIFAQVARVTTRGGVFAFSIESAPEGPDFVLLPNGRYAQSVEYVRRVAARCGLAQAEAFAQPIRGEPGSAVDGYVFVLVKT